VKNMKARTKLYPRFARVPITISADTAAIMLNGKLVDVGRKGVINGIPVRVSFCSEKQRDFLISLQERYKTPQQYYGKTKDGNYFIYGMHRWTHKNSANNRAKSRKITEDYNVNRLLENTENQAFTGKHRSGDIRFHHVSLKIEKPYKD